MEPKIGYNSDMRSRALFLASFLSLFPLTALAHEAYVLPVEELAARSSGAQFNIFAILGEPDQLVYFLLAGTIATALFFGALLFDLGSFGRRLKTNLESHAYCGPLLLRLGIGGALLVGAVAGNFLGPEIAFGGFPPLVMRVTAGLIGACVLLGLCTRIAAGAGLALYCIFFIPNGAYLFSYFGYVGALGALIVSGAGRLSVDQKFSRPGAAPPSVAVFVRITYGLMLLYGALAVKFLEPGLTLAVVERFNLAHGVFPHNPYMVVLGAALTELALALLIIAGLGLRFALLADLIFTTAALLYLPEPAWPHLIMYGIMFYLLVTPQRLALDAWIQRRFSP